MLPNLMPVARMLLPASQAWRSTGAGGGSSVRRLTSKSSSDEGSQGPEAARDSPISGQLYGRPDREPSPSPNAALTQASSGEMTSAASEQPSANPGPPLSGGGPGSGTATKQEGTANPDAYPVQNDPAVPGGASPDLESGSAQALQQAEEDQAAAGDGPRAAGQGVVEQLGRKEADPERYGSDRSSPA